MLSIFSKLALSLSLLTQVAMAGTCPAGYSYVEPQIYRDATGTSWASRKNSKDGNWYRWKFVMQFNGQSLLEHPSESTYRVWVPNAELATYEARACGSTAHASQVYDQRGSLFQCWDGNWRSVAVSPTYHPGYPPQVNPNIWRHPTKWYDPKWRSNHTNYIPDEELTPTEYNRIYSNPLPGSDFGYPR